MSDLRTKAALMRPLAAVAAALVLTSACAANAPSEAPQARLVAEDPPSSTASPTPIKASKVADPARIKIPSLGVDAPIERVGLAADGSMETPVTGRAGWYTEGPRPGEDGPAVVVAHVDSTQGPDVFYKLKQLRKGAKILVTDKAGKTHAFEAGRKKQTDKDSLPAKQIWGETDGPALRLITCGGEFDHRTNHYVANVIVWADKA